RGRPTRRPHRRRRPLRRPPRRLAPQPGPARLTPAAPGQVGRKASTGAGCSSSIAVVGKRLLVGRRASQVTREWRIDKYLSWGRWSGLEMAVGVRCEDEWQPMREWGWRTPV